MKRTLNLSVLIFLFASISFISSCKKDEVNITDVNGNIYHSVTLGSQVWMVENLKATRYNDGTDLDNITNQASWASAYASSYCWYDNDMKTYKEPFGALYNLKAVKSNKLCPAGWHIPTEAEWTTLTTFLGGEVVAGNELKEAGLTNWLSPNDGATNSSAFTALPGGCRNTEGSFYGQGMYGYWWSYDQDGADNANVISLNYNDGIVLVHNANTGFGASVRCLKN